VVDGDVDEMLEPDIARFDTVDRIQLRGNSRSFRHALDIACGSPEAVVFFVEDDYMWTDAAVAETIGALNSLDGIGYITPYAHPLVDDDSLPDVQRHLRREFTHAGRRWRTTPQNTMTFACTTQQLRVDRHAWWLASYGQSPKDGYAFWSILEGRWFTLVGNAAFRDVRRVLNVDTVKLVMAAARRRVGLGDRVVLVQPEDSLATHVHVPNVSGSTDWELLARNMAPPP